MLAAARASGSRGGPGDLSRLCVRRHARCAWCLFAAFLVDSFSVEQLAVKCAYGRLAQVLILLLRSGKQKIAACALY